MSVELSYRRQWKAVHLDNDLFFEPDVTDKINSIYYVFPNTIRL